MHPYSQYPLSHPFFRASTRITEIRKIIMKNGARKTPSKTPESTESDAAETSFTFEIKGGEAEAKKFIDSCFFRLCFQITSKCRSHNKRRQIHDLSFIQNNHSSSVSSIGSALALRFFLGDSDRTKKDCIASVCFFNS